MIQYSIFQRLKRDGKAPLYFDHGIISNSTFPMLVKVKDMLKKPELCHEINVDPQTDAGERMKATLHKLQILKKRISKLRARCEELQRIWIENESRMTLHCDECGFPIEQGQEIEAKNFGVEARHYHRECFRKLWTQ